LRLLDFFTNSTTLCSSYPHAYAQYHNKNRQHYDRNTAYAYPYFNLFNSEFTGNALDDAIKLTISQGAPAVYGEELGVSFDRVQEAIDALSRFDPGYGTEYSDDEILRELAMWKGMFFPKQMIQKMLAALQNGSFTPDTAALSWRRTSILWDTT